MQLYVPSFISVLYVILYYSASPILSPEVCKMCSHQNIINPQPIPLGFPKWLCTPPHGLKLSATTTMRPYCPHLVLLQQFSKWRGIFLLLSSSSPANPIKFIPSFLQRRQEAVYPDFLEFILCLHRIVQSCEFSWLPTADFQKNWTRMIFVIPPTFQVKYFLLLSRSFPLSSKLRVFLSSPWVLY